MQMIQKKLTSPKRSDMYSSQKSLMAEIDDLNEDLKYELHAEDIPKPPVEDAKPSYASRRKMDVSSESSVRSGKVIASSPYESKPMVKKRRRKKSSGKRGSSGSRDISNSSSLSSDIDDVASSVGRKSQIEMNSSKQPNTDKSSKEFIKKLKKATGKRSKSKNTTEQIESADCDKAKIKIIALHIIKSDIIKENLFLNKPFVRIWVANTSSDEIYTLDTLKTRPFNFLESRTLIPNWDEVILFDDKLSDKILDLTNIVILFEIVDIMADGENSIAWAFVKPLNNLNRRLKLQLYHVPKLSTVKFDAFKMWKSNDRYAYSSAALHVTVKSVNFDNVPKEEMIEMKLTLVQNCGAKQKGREVGLKESKSIPAVNKIGRKVEGKCGKIPNAILTTVDFKDDGGGCLVAKFSKCGKYLAFSAKDEDKYVIVIYEIPACNEVLKLFHHQGIIYDLSWNADSSRLISASADGSVCVWNMSDPKSYTKQRLSHDAYVYCARFCNSNENYLASGCFDKIIRIWSKSSKSKYAPSEKLIGHTGYVNAICFMENVETFFSADSNGGILKWTRGEKGWVKVMDINISEFAGKVINDLMLFPGGHKLVVLLRNDSPWAVDVASRTAITCYNNGYLNRSLSRGAITSCGTLIFESNNLWSASSGELYATFHPSQFDHYPIICTDANPVYDMIAFTVGFSLIVGCNVEDHRTDPDLGLEVFSNTFILDGIINNNKSEDDKRFKRSVLRVIEDKRIADPKGHHKVKAFKLWSLIQKMDSILFGAKNRIIDFDRGAGAGENVIPMAEMNGRAEEASKRSDLETFTVDNRLERVVVETGLEDTSSNVETYTIERETKLKMAPARRRPKRTVVHEIEETPSASSSGDSNTYTITKDNNNIFMI